MAIVAKQADPPRRRNGELPLLGVAMPGRRTYRVWQRNRDVFFQLWRTELVPPLMEPIVMFLALGLGLGTYVELTGDLDYIQFLAPGVLVIFPMFAATFESLWGAYWRLERSGTYAAILATPARPEEIVAGDILWAATRMLINSLLILLVMAVLTAPWDLIQSPWVILTIPVNLLAGVLFASLGLAYTSKAKSISQLSYFFSLFIMPMFWFSGAFFPLDGLPGWAEVLAWLTPVFHAVELDRALITGDLAWSDLYHLGWIMVMVIPAFWFALYSMRRRLVQ
jgi:lipooligosaccharide transport system permease protein